jgi:hypothetical protein
MATSSKVLARTAAATSSATLYTTPALTTTVVTNIIISNTAATTANATIAFDGVVVVPAVLLDANSVTALDIKQVLDPADLITGFATTTSVNFHISGVEIV